MGIFGAMNAAVSGLKAQSVALENISGNIANSQTTGYKRLDTTFSELVKSDSSAIDGQLSGLTRAMSRSTNSLQGNIEGSTVDTHMAINGDGYFIVQQASGQIDGSTRFDTTDYYTRRGDFSLDREGYLQNGSGYYLMGLTIDASTGNPAASIAQPIQVSNDFLAAEPTTEITYKANLPSYPLTSNADPDTADSELYDVATATSPGTTFDDTTGVGNVAANDETNFIGSTIAGGVITGFDSNGSTVDVQFRWAKVENHDGTATGSDKWAGFYLSDSVATADDPRWTSFGQIYEFDNSGGLTTPTSGQVTISSMTVNGQGLGDIILNHGNGSLTQYDDSNGATTVTSLFQDGSPLGEFSGVSISNAGRVVANYSNGRLIDIAEIQLASFNGEDMLRRVDGGAFAETAESGAPIYDATGQIVAQSLESSNTDIADEFSKLIITQQAYSANSRIITTSDEMLSETLNMVR